MTTPNMTPEQLRELKQLERRLVELDSQTARTMKDTKRRAKEISLLADLRQAQKEVRRAKARCEALQKQVIRDMQSLQKNEAKIIAGFGTVKAEIQKRIDILCGRLSS